MKRTLVGIGVILALVITMILTVGVKEAREVKAFDRDVVNIKEVKDGVYEGCSETTLVKVQVREFIGINIDLEGMYESTCHHTLEMIYGTIE